MGFQMVYFKDKCKNIIILFCLYLTQIWVRIESIVHLQRSGCVIPPVFLGSPSLRLSARLRSSTTTSTSTLTCTWLASTTDTGMCGRLWSAGPRQHRSCKSESPLLNSWLNPELIRLAQMVMWGQIYNLWGFRSFLCIVGRSGLQIKDKGYVVTRSKTT